ncbi:hypothetical protein ACH5RR_015390 [Cinchona calisaya]|uniref:Uncharacterized protein n=1 Tax=Cinchona calisaya TaxID=153742 RepID=A0ABD2ZT04_9GENT
MGNEQLITINAKCMYDNDSKWLKDRRRNAAVRHLMQANPSDFKALACQEDQVIWESNANGAFSVKLAMKIYSWEDDLNWLSSHWTFESFEDKLKRLEFVTMVYEIWKAMNDDIFKGKIVSAMGIIRAVVDFVKSSAMAWRNNKKTRKGWELALE